jgi:Na+-transporting methylmalonyl-CoA/oxaloacetate decarboxylase gamma subunit
MNPLLLFPLAAALPEHPALLESVAYQLNGLIVVFGALASIWLALELIGRFFRRQGEAAPAAVPSPAPVATPAGVPPEVVAAVTAAVHVALGERVRVAAVVPVPVTPWAHEGRREIFTSHHLR